MNPYGGQNPGRNAGGRPAGQPGGQPGAQPGQWQGGYPQSGYPGSPQQGGYSVPQGGQPAGPQGTQRFGQPGQYPAGPPTYGNGHAGGGPGGGNGGGNKGLIIAIVAIVAVVLIAGAVALGVSLRSDDSTTTASPVTFSAGATTTTAGAPTSGAVVPPSEPATQSDGFLTTAPKTTTGAGTGQTVRLKLSATGSGGVVVIGVRGADVPTASKLPWDWQGTATIGDTMSLIVTGTGPVTCTIVVNEQEFTRSGENAVNCTITRVAAP